MKKLYLFRHGETDWNKNKDLKLSEDFHNTALNETGIHQAEKLASFLQNKGIKKIYSSNLKRAQHTAKILNDLIKADLEIINGLEEFSFYDETVNGLTRQEVKELIGVEKSEMSRNSRNDLLDWRPLKCETRREARERFSTAILSVCQKDNHNIIGISTHGNILREFLRAVNFEDDSKVVNCEVIEAEFDNNIKIIKRIKTN